MKTRFLFPSFFFRPIGYLLAIPGFILGYLVVYRNYEIPGFSWKIRGQGYIDRELIENFTNELALMLAVTGLIFIAFSKIKKEDELTRQIRLNALYWAVSVNFMWCGAFMLWALVKNILNLSAINPSINSIDGTDKFFACNFVTPLLIFIARFYYLTYKDSRGGALPKLTLLKNRPFNIMGKWLSVLIIGVMVLNGVFVHNDNVSGVFWGLPIALVMWLFAKEKEEDEYITALRLDAMQIAIYFNYAILLISNMLFYGLDFLLVQALNVVTIPLIFQAWFQFRLYRLRSNDAKNGVTLSIL